MPKPRREVQKRLPTGFKWDDLGDGIKVLRLWKSSLGLKTPEIAILSLSAEMHKRFLRSPKRFINDHKIFSKQVRFAHRFGPKVSDVGASPEGDPLTVAVHGLDCGGRYYEGSF